MGHARKYCNCVIIFFKTLSKKFPIKIADKDTQQPIIRAVDDMLNLVERLQHHSDSFLDLAKTDLKISKPSRTMNSWHELDIDTFMATLENGAGGQEFSLAKKSEWLKHFNSEKARTDPIVARIKKLDAEIDHMVCDLYGLDKGDIAIVESGGL